MGITVKVGDMLLPKNMARKIAELLESEVAPVLGEFYVRQIAYTHDVQGRDEDDRQYVWPPRKLRTSGIVVFSVRSDLKRAISEMIRDKAKNALKPFYAIKQQIIEGEQVIGVGRYGKEGKFSHKQLMGSLLALTEEKRAKAAKKHFKKQIQEEFAKGEHADASKIAALKLEERRIPRKITSLRSARDSLAHRPRPVLFRTGTLRDSWNWKVNRQGNRVLLYIGTSVEYAAVHFDGSVKRNIPPRREFVLTRADKQMSSQLINGVLNKAFGAIFKKG